MGLFQGDMMKETKVFEDYSLVGDISALNLRIRRLALAEVSDSWQTDIIAWPFTRCYCVQKGHAFLHTLEGDIEMTAGNIYILPSGYPCGYSGDGDMFKFGCILPLHVLKHRIFLKK